MDKEKLIKIANHYGLQKQLEKFGEELAELDQAYSEYMVRLNQYDEDISLQPLIDELADVKIMISQMEYLLECKKEVADRVEFKLNRQIDRIELEKDSVKLN